MTMEIPGVVSKGLHPNVKLPSQGARKGKRPRPAAGRRQFLPPLHKDLKETLENLEKTIIQFNRRFEFDVNEEIDRIVVKVIDRETDKVIKEIPPEEIQHLLQQLKEMVGLLVNETI
jgi:flagellar protein FlaG